MRYNFMYYELIDIFNQYFWRVEPFICTHPHASFVYDYPAFRRSLPFTGGLKAIQGEWIGSAMEDLSRRSLLAGERPSPR